MLPVVERWIAEGKKVLIYSSGSVPGAYLSVSLLSSHVPFQFVSKSDISVSIYVAQKLLFKYTATAKGDMTPLFSGYYDTANAGMKHEASSYLRIIATEQMQPAEAWLFLSDNVKGMPTAPFSQHDHTD